MACGLPVVASAIGVNAEIVKEGGNGFLATTDQEWRNALSLLLDRLDLRRELGATGRRQVQDGFSLASQAPTIVSLFKSLS
jgi:glycosyltransferase involved in cell wall biosynthesis